MQSIWNEFKAFVMKGNLLELAIAFIMGLYFKDVVDTLTNGIVLAFVSAIFGKPNFAQIGINIGDARLLVGSFLNAVINFLLVAAVLFAIVKAYEQLRRRNRDAGEEVEPLSREGELLEEIRDLLRARA